MLNAIHQNNAIILNFDEPKKGYENQDEWLLRRSAVSSSNGFKPKETLYWIGPWVPTGNSRTPGASRIQPARSETSSSSFNGSMRRGPLPGPRARSIHFCVGMTTRRLIAPEQGCQIGSDFPSNLASLAAARCILGREIWPNLATLHRSTLAVARAIV